MVRHSYSAKLDTFLHAELDPNADLALYLLPPTDTGYDHSAILLDRSEYRKIVEEIWTPKLGEEVAVVGLYTTHYGQTKNIPIVRIGHIAMMPDEPVLSQKGVNLRAYLMEVKSIVGLSGSPVYLNIPPTRIVEGKLEYVEGRPRGPKTDSAHRYSSFLADSSSCKLLQSPTNL